MFKKFKIAKTLSFVVAFSIVLYIGSLFATGGTWKFLSEEAKSVAYDTLGDSILHLEADVRPSSISWEGFDINGKKYMYFGPFPVLTRIPLNAIFGKVYYGLWPRISCLLALSIIFFSAYLIFNFAINKNQNLKKSKNLLLVASTLAICLGTPIFHLISCCRIFNEAIIWALAWSMVAIATFFFIQKGNSSPLKIFILGLATSFSLLSKITFALPLYFLCIYCFVKLLKEHKFSIKYFFSFATSLGFGIGVQFWYDFKRFGSIWTTYPLNMNYVQEAKEYGFFNIHRIYDSFKEYILPHLNNIQSTFPFFIESRPTISDENLKYFMKYTEPLSPLFLTSSFTIILVAFAIFYFFKHKKDKEIYTLFLPCILFFALQCIFILGFYFLTERYIAEFIPFIFILSIIFLLKVKNSTAIFSFIFLSFVSVASMGLSTVYGIKTYFSDTRANWVYTLRNLSQDGKLPNENSKDLTPIYLKELPMTNNTWTFQEPYFRDDIETNAKSSSVGNVKNIISLHADSTLSYNIPQNAKYFEAILDLDIDAKFCNETSVGFQIVDENEKPISRKFSFGPKQDKRVPYGFYGMDESPLPIRIPLNSQKKLTLKIYNLNNAINCDHLSVVNSAFLIDKNNG